jgi:hypothetical protein
MTDATRTTPPPAVSVDTLAIVNRLHAYYEARDRAREWRRQLIEIAIGLGQEPQDANVGQQSMEFLQGVLAGRGVRPKMSGNR